MCLVFEALAQISSITSPVFTQFLPFVFVACLMFVLLFSPAVDHSMIFVKLHPIITALLGASKGMFLIVTVAFCIFIYLSGTELSHCY